MVYTGTWLVLATVAIILLLFFAGYYWGKTHGQFDNPESAKYTVFDDDAAEADHGH